MLMENKSNRKQNLHQQLKLHQMEMRLNVNFVHVYTTNGLDCVVIMTAFTASSFNRSARAISHAAVKNGTFGTINGSN